MQIIIVYRKYRMTRTQETKDLTSTAFWEILSEGKPPTVDLVLGWMATNGHGSRQRNAISDGIRQCWEIVGQRTKSNHTIPGIPKETVDLVVSLRDQMLSVAKADFEKDLHALTTRCTEQIDDQIRQVERATTELVHVRENLAATENANTKLSSDIERLTLELEDVRSKSFALNQALEQRSSEKATLEAQNQSLRREIETAEALRQAAVRSEQERFNSMQHALQLQCDELKTAKSKLEKDNQRLESTVQIQLKESQVRERHFGEAQSQLSAQLGNAQGMVESLRHQLADAAALVEAKSQELLHLKVGEAKLTDDLARADAAISRLESEVARRVAVSGVELQDLLIEAFQAGSAAAEKPEEAGVKKRTGKEKKEMARLYALNATESLPR